MKIILLLLILVNILPTFGMFWIESHEDKCRENDGAVIDEICCPNSCVIDENSTNSSDSLETDATEIIVDEDCCPIDSINESNTCEENDPPCYIEQDIIFNEFLFEKSLLELIIAAVVGLLLFIFLTYVCCCFGSKQPPVPYEQIIGKID